MGSIVSSWLGQNEHSCKMRICGVKAYGQSGRSEEVLDNMGLSESAIVDQVKELLN
jgi:transketolase C-terminal domain/subunit